MLFALMANLSVLMITHVANFPLVHMAVVHFCMLFVAVMKSIAVLRGTPAMFQLGLAIKGAKVQVCCRRWHY